MPKHKSNKPAKEAEAKSSSDSDSGPEDRGPVKKSKPNVSTGKKSDGDSLSWDLGKNRFVKLTEFKGKWFVNIREFYDAGGELKPGKKGIMLTMEQWQTFRGCIGDIDEAVKRNI